MQLCKKCSGTGHNGNCDPCGGSGFIKDTPPPPPGYTGKPIEISRPTLYMPRKGATPSAANSGSSPTTAYIVKKKSRKATRRFKSASNPFEMSDNQHFAGFSKSQLRFPEDRKNFEPAQVRRQIERIKLQYIRIDFIQWKTPDRGIIKFLNGNSVEEIFTTQYKVKQTGSMIVQADVPVERAPRHHAKTIPHPSQSGSLLTPSKHNVDKPKRIRVIRGNQTIREIEKASSIMPSPKHVKKNQKKRQPLGDSQYAQKSAESAGPTAFELAFQAAKRDQLDATREWAGFRDGGKFGSHPAFDPSDDSYNE